jgi:peptidoglycan hydrolase-like protein with peptidoglycan-binding domain
VFKIKNLFVVSVGVLVLGGVSQASMLDQLIYNVAGQATNAAGARLGDEIYYGSSRSTPQKTHHVKHRKHKKKRYVAPRDTPEMKIQRALSSLGFYRGRIDGEINSFETRSAIKDLNIGYGISNSASLLPEEKNSLVFLGTLFDFDRHLISRSNDKRSKGRKIQTALKIHGFYFSKIDGAVGPGTRRSITEYKASTGQSYGNALDFEEEYQLVSSAKEMNDKSIEDTINAIKAMGKKYVAPVQQQVQVPPVAQQPMQNTAIVPMQRVQVSQPAAVQVAQPIQQQAATPESAAMPDASSIEMYTDQN